MQEAVDFYSWGCKIAGVLHIPDNFAPGQRRPAVVMSHGMANDRDESGQHTFLAKKLEEMGYVVLRFDFRGCGLSGAPRGRMLIGTEWPQDLRSAITYVRLRPEVNPEQIGAVGSSWGGGVTAYTAAIDKRIKAAVSLAGPASGERWLRHQWVAQHGEDGWGRFLADVAIDRKRRIRGEPSKVVRLIGGFIPVEPEQIPFFDEFLAAHPIMVSDVPLEVADDVLFFWPEEMANRIAPTPIRYIHGTADPVVDPQEARVFYERSGEPKDLRLIEDGIHQLLSPEDSGEDKANETADLVLEWFEKYLSWQEV
jgi:alpha-beta hydrolase superfamily lysophospholipase